MGGTRHLEKCWSKIHDRRERGYYLVLGPRPGGRGGGGGGEESDYHGQHSNAAFRRVYLVQPGTLDWAEARYESRYGTIKSHWKIKDDGDKKLFHLAITVPPNSIAWVITPEKQGSKDTDENESGVGSSLDMAEINFALRTYYCLPRSIYSNPHIPCGAKNLVALSCASQNRRAAQPKPEWAPDIFD
ncbi:hypothetical protein N7474_010789 [Penicillium riverlandense]|uniref:uncharacterized protein n=1 Tax=Penicillium riverlandense TaxID=1903569 RepID=UPI00254800BE|nr:uncharacterized protein N7474_010789 [Penicillium riverlandense]KAJ5804902.1 hypothetical protein N7474_010789 [Penicillium riverlandense]